MTPTTSTIEEQKSALSAKLVAPMEQLAQKCAEIWPDKSALDRVLQEGLPSIPLCRLVYAIDPSGTQISANVSAQGLSERFYGQDLSQRPFMTNVLPSRGFILSDVYISRGTERPTVTAVLAVLKDEHVAGFIAADFDLRDLPLSDAPSTASPGWRQIKGDPSIRETVFMQQRALSDLDQHIDDVIATINELMCERGIFHVQIHYSSSRATLWSMADP
ncbi:MAG: PDC sensor domain-containing protein, partial [Gallionellaceae bacterium]|nr:PDC sensor domain-containing protein [Gallionellaceae bacterium]